MVWCGVSCDSIFGIERDSGFSERANRVFVVDTQRLERMEDFPIYFHHPTPIHRKHLHIRPLFGRDIIWQKYIPGYI